MSGFRERTRLPGTVECAVSWFRFRTMQRRAHTIARINIYRPAASSKDRESHYFLRLFEKTAREITVPCCFDRSAASEWQNHREN